MSEIATASLNSFGISPEADFVPPSEDPVFILTSSQLQAIVAQAIEKAIQPLQDEVRHLQATVARQGEKIAALEATTDKQAENELFQLRLINSLREVVQKPTVPTPPPKGEKTLARIAKLKDFLKTRGSGATFQECERLLGIKPNQMSALITKLDKRSFEVFTRVGDGRQRVIRLKVQIASRER
jgi:hypothetical protein